MSFSDIKMNIFVFIFGINRRYDAGHLDSIECWSGGASALSSLSRDQYVCISVVQSNK